MKITDLALVFVAILLPIIIIVYVNVSYTIKAEEQEMFYKKVINIATEDAASQMKEVENTDTENDYGYSGLQNSKVSINANIAKDAFLNSLYNNFGIKGNDAAQRYLQTFIPVIAILDYNGVYISSEEKINNTIEHVIKPKKYYTYSYSIVKNGSNFEMIDGLATSGDIREYHTIEFTMDDYITHRGCSAKTNTNYETKSFYISDSNNNDDLCRVDSSFKETVVERLLEKRRSVIIATIVNQISYYTDAANKYAKNAGIDYTFVFPTITNEEMSSAINNVGIFAFVQGLNTGNKYLNAKSYSTAKLKETDKYYFSIYRYSTSKIKLNLYHKDENCPEYKKANHNGDGRDTVITPTYVTTKQQAASAQVTYTIGGINNIVGGFYPCPICNP